MKRATQMELQIFQEQATDLYREWVMQRAHEAAQCWDSAAGMAQRMAAQVRMGMIAEAALVAAGAQLPEPSKDPALARAAEVASVARVGMDSALQALARALEVLGLDLELAMAMARGPGKAQVQGTAQDLALALVLEAEQSRDQVGAESPV